MHLGWSFDVGAVEAEGLVLPLRLLECAARQVIAERAAGNQWRAAAFINPISYDRTGAPVTLLGILAARGRLTEVFDARHWRAAREDAFKLHEALEAFGMKDKVSLAPFVAALKREDINARQQAQRPDKFKL